MTYEIKTLSCNPAKLKGLSEKLIVSHYENNYSGAVNRLNAITEQLESLDFATAPVFVINGLKREELIASNSMILHELYFDSLGGGSQPNGDLRGALARDFGSVEKWQIQFAAMGKALGGGSGWVLLTYSSRDKKLVNQWAADHTCCLAGASPILALICMNIPITLTTARKRRHTSMPSCRTSTGIAPHADCLTKQEMPLEKDLTLILTTLGGLAP
jgi:superoxide dismutase, Fe-Mn family